MIDYVQLVLTIHRLLTLTRLGAAAALSHRLFMALFSALATPFEFRLYGHTLSVAAGPHGTSFLVLFPQHPP